MLFEPIEIRDLKLRNRSVVSPMCQYTAVNGVMNEWHLNHLNTFGRGGFGLVIFEATAVEARGRITHGCTGLWNEEQLNAMIPIVANVKSTGAATCLQLAHAGRKASCQRPWEGDAALTEIEFSKGELAWDIVGPSDLPFEEGWLVPNQLSKSEINDLVDTWVKSTNLAILANFDAIEMFEG